MTTMAESLIDCVVEAIRPLLSDISLPYDMVAKMHVKDGLLIEIAQAAITAMGDASCEVKESKEPCPSLTNQTLIGKLNAIRLDWQTDAQQDKVYAMDYIIPIVASHLERESGYRRLKSYLEVIASEKDDHLNFDAQAYAQQALSDIEGGS